MWVSGERSVPVGGSAAPGQVVVWARRRARYDGLLHRRHISRVRFEQRGVFAGQHGALVPAELSSPVLEPNLEPETEQQPVKSLFLLCGRWRHHKLFTEAFKGPEHQQWSNTHFTSSQCSKKCVVYVYTHKRQLVNLEFRSQSLECLKSSYIHN